MKISRKLTLLCLGMLALGQLYAQLGEPSVIPPAPNAAKIQQFELTPTSLYTGTQNLSVPLYSFNFDGQDIGLSLSYASGGIRVNEEASWVGLGWALNNLGTVSRTIVGFNDFNGPTAQAGGYIYDTQEIPDNITTTNAPGFEWWDGPFWSYLMAGGPPRDTEPDKFSYSFLGSSGSFVLSKKHVTGSIEVVKLKENTDKIVFDEDNNLFTVTTPSGFKGTFDIHEYSTSLGGSTGTSDKFHGCTTTQIGDLLQHFNEGKRAITTWHLSEIESPNGLKLHVEYKTETSGYSDYLSKSAESFGEMKSFDYTWSTQPDDYQSCSFRVFEHIYPHRLYSDDIDLEIVYNTATRTDIRKLESSYENNFKAQRDNQAISFKTPLRLTGLTITGTHPLSTFSKTVTLNQTYFGSTNYKFLRLKLNSVTIDDQTWSFSYLAGQGIPDKTTFGVDYWGYYNGENSNTRLVPVSTSLQPVANFLIGNAPSPLYYYQTDDRKADFSYGQWGLMDKVTYPTGGSTEYDYEGHTYKMEGQEQAVTEGNDTYFANAGPNGSGVNSANIPYTGHFLNSGTCVEGSFVLTVSVNCNPPYNNCTVAPVDEPKKAVEIVNVSTGLSVASFATLYFDDLRIAGSGSYSETHYLQLPPGTYKVKSYNVTDGQGNILYYGAGTVQIPKACNSTISGTQNSQFINQTAGGARIKTITNYDENSLAIQKRSFNYNEQSTGSQFTSGRLINPLYSMSIDCDADDDGVPNTNGCLYLFHSGDAIAGGGSAQGNHVGYSQVKETFDGVQGGTIGLKLHYFVNNVSVLSPYGISASIAYSENGQLDFQSTYSAGNDFIQSTDNVNSSESVGSIKAMKLFYMGGQFAFGSAYSYDRVFTAPQQVIVEEGLGSNQLKTTTTYTYDDYMLATESSTNSNGLVTSKQYRYPKDIVSPNSVITQMRERNHRKPIETITVVDSSIEGAFATKYKLENGLIVAESGLLWNEDKGVFLATPDGDTFAGGYEEKVFFTRYDSRGNVQEFTNESGVKTTILWGYGGNYAVAQIQNASYDEVSAVVNQTNLDGNGVVAELSNLRASSALTNALITTMTFDPHVGMISQTTPDGLKITYEYDQYERLKYVKDHQGNILKKFEYQYKTVATNTDK